MTPKEKADNLLKIYSVFEWSGNGYKLDKELSINTCISICQEVLLALNEIDYNEPDTTVYNMCLFYNNTITELKKTTI